MLANGDGSAHSSNGGSGSGRSRGSGRSPGRSGESSGGCPDPAELLTMQGQHGMGVLPEDSDVIGMQQVVQHLLQPPCLYALYSLQVMYAT